VSQREVEQAFPIGGTFGFTRIGRSWRKLVHREVRRSLRNTSQGGILHREIRRSREQEDATGYTNLTALHTTDGRQPCASHRPAPHLSCHTIMHKKDNLTEVAISCASEKLTL
jgi:hypothetical protein